jgi:hypothetical protein
MGKIDLSIGKLTDSQDATTRELRALRREARQQPANVKLSSVFTWSSAAGAQMCQQGLTGAGVMIGGPNLGEQWSISQIICGGPTLASTATGQAWFLVSAAPPNEQSITSVVAIAATMPSCTFYSPGEIYLAPNENLWMVVVGGVNGNQYVASVSYQASSFVPRATEVASV